MMLSTPSTTSSTVNVRRPSHAFGSASQVNMRKPPFRPAAGEWRRIALAVQRAASILQASPSDDAMAFDEALATRIRKRLGKRPDIAEKKMFGGVAFLLNGNMCVGVHADELIVRLAADETAQALTEPHTRVFD